MLRARCVSWSLAVSRLWRVVSSWRWFSSILACTASSWLLAWLYFSTAISDCTETSERRAWTASRRSLALATDPAAGAAGAVTSRSASATRARVLMRMRVLR